VLVFAVTIEGKDDSEERAGEVARIEHRLLSRAPGTAEGLATWLRYVASFLDDPADLRRVIRLAAGVISRL
jgi:hypothetical protein